MRTCWPRARTSPPMPERDSSRSEAEWASIVGAHPLTGQSLPDARPSSIWVALARGAVGRCPSCGSAKLFSRFLKPISDCLVCRQDWTPQQADDFPAYASIFLTGHILAPLIIMLAKDAGLSVGALMAIVVPLATIMIVGFIQPVKGAIIALQWWFGMHGFKAGKDRVPDSQGKRLQ